MIEDDEKRTELRRVGLCLDCRYTQLIESPRKSTFYLCKLSDSDPNFAKYPRLPVLHCLGYAPKADC